MQNRNRIHKSEYGNQNTEVRIQRTTIVIVALLFFVISAFLSAAAASAAEQKKAAAEKKTAKEPTVITSQSLTTDNKAHTALFEGNVVAKKGEMTLFANKMLVYYSEEKGSSNIKKIEAEGNVKLIKGERVVTSKFATYFAEPVEHAVFTGDPRASEGENVVTGTKMTYFMNDDHSIVENSKVFLTERKRGTAEAGK